MAKTIVSPGLAGVDVANGRPLVFKPKKMIMSDMGMVVVIILVEILVSMKTIPISGK